MMLNQTVFRNLSRIASSIKSSQIPLVCSCQELTFVPVRANGYLKSKLEEPRENYTEVEKSFSEWVFVEKLLPPTFIPEPPVTVEPLPSGWRSQNLEAVSKLSYFVPRTRNHMMPVYYKEYNRGEIKRTLIRHVEGNMWRLEEDVGRYLKKMHGKSRTIITWVHEVSRVVHIKGDYQQDVKQFLLDKGF